NVPDAYADARFDRNVDLRTGFRTLNMLCVPVWGPGGTVVGVIQALNKRDGTFERRDQMLLEQVAETVAPVLAKINTPGWRGASEEGLCRDGRVDQRAKRGGEAQAAVAGRAERDRHERTRQGRAPSRRAPRQGTRAARDGSRPPRHIGPRAGRRRSPAGR